MIKTISIQQTRKEKYYNNDNSRSLLVCSLTGIFSNAVLEHH